MCYILSLEIRRQHPGRHQSTQKAPQKNNRKKKKVEKNQTNLHCVRHLLMNSRSGKICKEKGVGQEWLG